MQNLLKVENLSKKFCRNFRTSLFYGLKDILNEFFGKEKKFQPRKHEFIVLNNINFKLKRGESLAILGNNGAGKSTILKLLTGIIKPEQGKITTNGKVCALIQLSAGFNLLLSGRENIYIKAAMFGLTKKETNLVINDIISFAELEKSIDAPIQSYSSGMITRLGFAIAIFSSPDVLIFDEILAVGDMKFRAKCHNKIQEMLPNVALIFISHNIQSILNICNKAIILENGQIVDSFDDINIAIEEYLQNYSNPLTLVNEDDNQMVSDIRINEKTLVKNLTLDFSAPFSLEFSLDNFYENCRCELHFLSQNQQVLAFASKKITASQMHLFIEKLSLATKCCYICLKIVDDKSQQTFYNKIIAQITITNIPHLNAGYIIDAK